MGDLVNCIAVLKRNPDPRDPDRLCLETKPGDFVHIPCRQVPCEPSPDYWRYGIEGDRLHLTPSLLVKTGTLPDFHTDFDWFCRYQEAPHGVSEYDLFYELNPKQTS